MTKYKKAVEEMLEYNHDLFVAFKKLHDNFVTDPVTFKDEFNAEGEKVLRIVRRYENMLCGKSESVGFSKYSVNLSEKFWNEVKTHFPKIDQVGMQ